MKTCSVCKELKEDTNFSVNKRNLDGTVKYRNSWCNVCRNLAEINRRGGRKKPIPKVELESKECLECLKMLELSKFSPSKRGRLGVASYCRDCQNLRVKNNPNYLEKARLSTAKYRQVHREKYLAAHRISQFNRRSKIKATCDGTLTEDVLKFIYSLVHCYWCKKEIEYYDRTIEHKKELSAGGLHSISNVRMACKSCNSARKGKSNGRD